MRRFGFRCFSPGLGQDLSVDQPPFSQIVRVIDKLVQDRAQAILIVPFWPRRQYVRRLASLAAKIWEIPPHTEVFELEGTKARPTRWPVWAVYINPQKWPRAPPPVAPAGADEADRE